MHIQNPVQRFTVSYCAIKLRNIEKYLKAQLQRHFQKGDIRQTVHKRRYFKSILSKLEDV